MRAECVNDAASGARAVALVHEACMSERRTRTRAYIYGFESHCFQESQRRRTRRVCASERDIIQYVLVC